jgi:hypothetical protein
MGTGEDFIFQLLEHLVRWLGCGVVGYRCPVSRIRDFYPGSEFFTSQIQQYTIETRTIISIDNL